MTTPTTQPSIPLDVLYSTSRAVRPYQRRNGRRTYLFRFTYSIEGVRTLLPLQITVRSVNRVSAARTAMYQIRRAQEARYGSMDAIPAITLSEGYRINVNPSRPRQVANGRVPERWVSFLTATATSQVD